MMQTIHLKGVVSRLPAISEHLHLYKKVLFEAATILLLMYLLVLVVLHSYPVLTLTIITGKLTWLRGQPGALIFEAIRFLKKVYLLTDSWKHMQITVVNDHIGRPSGTSL